MAKKKPAQMPSVRERIEEIVRLLKQIPESALGEILIVSPLEPLVATLINRCGQNLFRLSAEFDKVDDAIVSVILDRWQKRNRRPDPETVQRAGEILTLRDQGMTWPAISKRYRMGDRWAENLIRKLKKKGLLPPRTGTSK